MCGTQGLSIIHNRQQVRDGATYVFTFSNGREEVKNVNVRYRSILSINQAGPSLVKEGQAPSKQSPLFASCAEKMHAVLFAEFFQDTC